MNRVFSYQDRNADDIGHVSIAICQPGADQRHLGIIHRSSRTLMMLHLAGHHQLQNDPPSGDLLCIEPNIPPERMRQIAAYCRSVWRENQNGRVPYGFSPPSDFLDEHTGQMLLGPTRHGLTCATFVLAVFHGTGFPLVRYSKWPVGRLGDNEWQLKIVNVLERRGASPEHVKAMRSEIGTARFRPEEVAGAGTSTVLPASFQLAALRGRQIVHRLEDDHYRVAFFEQLIDRCLLYWSYVSRVWEK
jgi:hypothetical protein